MSMTPREYIDFLHIADRLKDNIRHCYTEQGREESVAEHSWRTSLMAMLLLGKTPEGLDLNKVIQMCILHDLGEALTGDIPSFWKTQQDTEKEDHALFQLLGTLPEPLQSSWKALFTEMLALQTEEAKLYHALDKLESVLQHNESPLSTWLDLERTLNQTYGMEEALQTIPFVQEVRQLAVLDTQRKLQEEDQTGDA